jgi:hypothetical protein
VSFQNAKVHVGAVNPDAYHAQEFERGDKRLAMSPSSLKAFGQCPSRWRAGYNSPESDAKDFGSLLDCLALTPDLFETRYAVSPATYPAEGKKKGDPTEDKPWNWNATFCKDWRKDQGGKRVISQSELAEAKAAVAALRRDSVIADFIDASDTQVLVTADYHDEATGLVIPVRCLMDFVPRKDSEFPKSLGDLKTTRSAALQPFTRFAFQMGYHVQAGFDLDLFVAATGEDRCNWCFILQENYPPFQTGKRLLSEDFITLGRVEYRRLLAAYCWCLKNGKWPSYDDTDEAIQGWSLIAPEPWMESQAMFAPKFTTEEPPPTETEETLDTIP